jgi:hypothetical protein
MEIKMHTTLYWEVPDGVDPQAYINHLKSTPKDVVLLLATDFGDSEYEVNDE